MAINSAPFAIKNQGLDAEQLRQAVASLAPNGGGVVNQSDFPVTQTTTPSLGVLVGVGRAWLPGTNVTNLSGQTFSTQGMYFVLNDANVTVTLSTANATNPRIDLIYVGALDSAYSGASDLIKIDKVTGTAAATPAVPALPKNAIALAQVAVAANATSVTNANITTLVVSETAPAVGVIATTLQTSGTTLFGTTEQQISSVSAYLVSGRQYRIRASVDANSNTSGTYVQYKVKYGNTGGITGTSTRSVTAAYTTNGYGQSCDIVGQPFTAAATGLSTCVLTAQIVVQTSATITASSGTPANVSICVEDLG
jgi:hypothetical protein